ncbi:hypothetical protein B0J13DRAFT_631063 [Dactylonectria estremocensis]|uniref:Cyanovirin-N domain-containing protein n=1 Tax=Dactylonectria estremocensis TaxID=1079267 RepID=A0A9P9D5K0_9HYPO|nr:hypothetical protein B0J13DRAFT_631063 [Dactylonectria estremocensis]
MKFFVTISALTSMAAAAELTAGNWAYTCKDEELESFTLKAKCKDTVGDYLDTSIDLNTCLAWSTAEANIAIRSLKQAGGNLSNHCSDCLLPVSSYEGDEGSGDFIYQLTCNCPGPGNPYWANIFKLLPIEILEENG